MEQLVVEKARTQRDLNTHGTEEQLELYALHRLPPTEVAPLEEHLLICAACRDKLNGIADFAAGMRDAGVESVSRMTQPGRGTASGLASFLRRPAVSMTLAFAALIVAIGIFSNDRTQLASSAALQLVATGGETPSTVPARQIDLKLTDAPREGGPFKIEVLNAAGAAVWSGLADTSPSGVNVTVMQRLPQGVYSVRVYSAAGQMLREYGFRVR